MSEEENTVRVTIIYAVRELIGVFLSFCAYSKLLQQKTNTESPHLNRFLKKYL